MPKYKLGKRPARPGAYKLRLGFYLNVAALPPLPATFGHEGLISSWGTLGNDDYGDCVWAGAAHETMLLNKEAGVVVSFTDAAVLSDYTAVTGFNPNDPNSDDGTDVQTAAAYRQKTGVIDAAGNRHKIAAYLALDPGNLDHLYYASYLFGAVGIGIQFPESAMDQFSAGQPWDVVKGASIDGGHYIPLVARRDDGLHVITWGKNQTMTENFLRTYCDEAVAYISQEALVNQKSPEGFDYVQLSQDLQSFA
jgi:hypothetical protein